MIDWNDVLILVDLVRKLPVSSSRCNSLRPEFRPPPVRRLGEALILSLHHASFEWANKDLFSSCNDHVRPVMGFRSVSSHRIAWLKILLIASRIFLLVPPASALGLPNFVVTSVLSHCSTATVLMARNSSFPQWGTTHRFRSCVFLGVRPRIGF